MKQTRLFHNNRNVLIKVSKATTNLIRIKSIGLENDLFRVEQSSIRVQRQIRLVSPQF